MSSSAITSPGQVSPWVSYSGAGLMAAAATVTALIVDQATHIPNLSLIFVLPVVAAAAAFGWGAAMFAAVAGVLAYNFFLIEPRYTLRVADPANAWALLWLLVVATVVSAVAAQSRKRALIARTAAAQAEALQSLARDLVGAANLDQIAAACSEALSRLFDAPAVILIEVDHDLSRLAQVGAAGLSDADEDAARWSLASRLPTRGGAYPASEATYDFWPVISQQRRCAVVGVRIADVDRGRPADPGRLIEIVAGYLAVALDREAFAAEAMDARVRNASDMVKADLLAAVSHDLKTPLSTILFTLQSLRKFTDGHDAKTRDDLLALAEKEATRLNAMVVNLLDVGRLEAGALAVHPTPVDPIDLVVQALHRCEPVLAGHRVQTTLATGCPPWLADPALAVTALANVIENAAKYATPGSPIAIRGGCEGGVGWIEIFDEGPGFPEPIEPLFAKFARGVEGDGRAPGTGLGLAIARGFMEAQGGGVEASNRADRRGARVRLSAPLAVAGTSA